MRIISGKYKGRVFNSKLPTGIRPTQDAMRETIFNVLNNHIDFADKIIADVCAGSGMLGIEALSRGANFVYFVDKNRKATEFIQNNLNSINAEKEFYKILNLDAVQFINHFANSEFLFHSAESGIDGDKLLDLLFLDPPYNTNIVNDILHFVSENAIMNAGGIIITESSIHYQILLPTVFKKITERQFGASKITFISARTNG